MRAKFYCGGHCTFVRTYSMKRMHQSAVLEMCAFPCGAHTIREPLDNHAHVRTHGRTHSIQLTVVLMSTCPTYCSWTICPVTVVVRVLFSDTALSNTCVRTDVCAVTCHECFRLRIVVHRYAQDAFYILVYPMCSTIIGPPRRYGRNVSRIH